MAASCPPSAPSTGVSVPQGSRLQLGAGCRVPEEAGWPFSHVQFPPFWGVHRPAPAAQPRSGDVLNQRLAVGRELCSETRLAFPEKPLEPVTPIVPPASCVRMHADPRIQVLTSTTRENYPCPDVPPQRPALPKAQEWSDNVLCGDREKIRLPPSVYTFSYPAHEIQPVARARHVYRGCPIKGDGRSYYHTSYQAQFKGEWSPPVKPSEKHMSRIKFGDPRSSGSVSEQKHAYTVPDKRKHRVYDKERAVFQIHHTNLQLGDGCTRFSTSTSELFPVHNLEPVAVARPNRNASSIPRGDEDPENLALARMTTTQFFYPETGRWNFSPKPDLQLQKHQSSICLGADRSGSCYFSTTQQSDYQPPHQTQRVTGGKNQRGSHIPFDYHNESPVTTTQAMLVPHRQQKRQLSEDMLQQMKCSHLVLPWRAQDLFSTEQKDAFTPKYRGPAEIQTGDSQVSRVPLGTLKGYCPRRKVVFAP
ncbi:testis-expressed protein 45 [Aythya fuligula]|uniref:Testis-expressed protein 45 n=1 Tax=Aythya fuligula TaxID=219594 RepID=A0A6J3EET0_AYTFU|nr:testis-expressed protein 45 [Aythya fuligula]